MTHRMRVVLLVAALALVVLVAVVAADPEMRGQTLEELGLAEAASQTLRASGFLEIPTIELAGEAGGRVRAIPVEHGQMIQAGDVLVELEREYLLAQVQAASAQLEAARHQLELLEAGARAVHLAVAQAGLELAEAVRVAVEADRSASDEQLVQAEAGVKAAQAALDALEEGASAKEISAAKAGVEAAEAQLTLLESKLEAQTLRAPSEAIVLEVFPEVGELALPGAPLVMLGSVDEIVIEVFVAESELASVSLGQQVEVKVDSVREAPFDGVVVGIAPEAEFTPRTVDDTEILQYMVRIKVEATLAQLKPGLIGEVDFGGGA